VWQLFLDELVLVEENFSEVARVPRGQNTRPNDSGVNKYSAPCVRDGVLCGSIRGLFFASIKPLEGDRKGGCFYRRVFSVAWQIAWSCVADFPLVRRLQRPQTEHEVVVGDLCFGREAWC